MRCGHNAYDTQPAEFAQEKDDSERNRLVCDIEISGRPIAKSHSPKATLPLDGLLPWRKKCCKSFLENNLQVAGGGLEPPTHGFSVRCSTN